MNDEKKVIDFPDNNNLQDTIKQQQLKERLEQKPKDTDTNENANLLEELFNGLEQIDPSMGGFEGISALLGLPDEQFMLMQNVILDEMERALNNTNDKLIFAQALNASGVKVEEFLELYANIIERIDEQLGEVLTQPKLDFLKRILGMIANTMSNTNGIAKRVIEIPIELCRENAKFPAYACAGDAGLDVYATEDISINPGETKLLPLGIKVALPLGYELQVRPRSGMSLKTKLRIANSPGTIDSGYKDEIGVIVENIDNPIRDITYHFTDDRQIVIDSILHGSNYVIDKGQKFAQLVLSEVSTAAFYEVSSVKKEGEPDRGGGFGHSGK